MDRLSASRRALAARGLDGWLVFSFHDSNPVLRRVAPGLGFLTRRTFLWIPAEGEPVLLGGAVDEGNLRAAGLAVRAYTHHASLVGELKTLLAGARRIAMEYAPGGALPYASRVDGGTLDLVRACGVEIVTSADVYQETFATLAPDEVRSHREAARHLDEAKDAIFAHAFSEALAGKAVAERDLQERLARDLRERGLTFDHPPIVAANANSADPHYSPPERGSADVRKGDWLLVDLWAKVDRAGSVYADITWCANLAREVPARRAQMFEAVRDAREAGVSAVDAAARAGRRATGAEVDGAVRAHLARLGLADRFTHRTGHSVGSEVHGDGANLDGFETLDTRELVPGLLVTVEPGVYFPGAFGVRSEIDVLIGPDGRPEVTTRAQREVATP